MIKGKAEIKFGKGDIKTTMLIQDNIGIYVLQNSEPHKIGDSEPVQDSFSIQGKPVMITFSKLESLDVVIKDLQDIRELMLNGSERELRVLKTSTDDFWKPFRETCF